MRRLVIALGFALGLAACDGCDGTSAAVDATPLDAASVGPTWRLEARPITALSRYRDTAAVVAGRSLRIGVEHTISACDLWAMPAITRTADTVTITAQVFARTPPCTLTTQIERVVTVELGAGTWTVRAAGPTPPAPLTVVVGPAPSRACGGVATCALDCDCDQAAGERCVGDRGGAATVCARPCELDRDCAGAGACVDDDLGAFRACVAAFECTTNFPCPAGFTCTAGACAATFTLSAAVRRPCGGDGDCAAPLRCVQATAGADARCELACRTGGPWCAAGHGCDLAARDAAGLAATDSVCVARP